MSYQYFCRVVWDILHQYIIITTHLNIAPKRVFSYIELRISISCSELFLSDLSLKTNSSPFSDSKSLLNVSGSAWPLDSRLRAFLAHQVLHNWGEYSKLDLEVFKSFATTTQHPCQISMSDAHALRCHTSFQRTSWCSISGFSFRFVCTKRRGVASSPFRCRYVPKTAILHWC